MWSPSLIQQIFPADDLIKASGKVTILCSVASVASGAAIHQEIPSANGYYGVRQIVYGVSLMVASNSPWGIGF